MDQPSTLSLAMHRPHATESYFKGGDIDARINTYLLYAIFERMEIAYDHGDDKEKISSHHAPENYSIRIVDQHIEESPHYIFVFEECNDPTNSDYHTYKYQVQYTVYQSVYDEETGEGRIVENPGFYEITVKLAGSFFTNESYAHDLLGDIDRYYQRALKEHLPTYAIMFSTKPESRIRYY